ncbi:MAG: hypothetical protein GX304_05485 [Clostridiales bacterium]|jgi:protein arginine kinase activator|nr:hypothetical protein [Clostridiales bacterium]
MLCSECKVNPATIHITNIINGVKKEMHICAECAKKYESLGGFKFVNDDFFMPLLGFDLDDLSVKVKACPTCGTRLSDFNKSGYLGCADCYSAFGDSLRAVIKRVQGSLKYVGKVPLDDSETTQLREYERLSAELKKAIEEERYEDAAKIRDKLRKIR